VIPRGGYRLENMIDDMPGVALAANNPSAEGFRTAMGQNPSAEGWMATERRADSPGEVRESAAVYRIDRRAG
jgi:hypothetical protein